MELPVANLIQATKVKARYISNENHYGWVVSLGGMDTGREGQMTDDLKNGKEIPKLEVIEKEPLKGIPEVPEISPAVEKSTAPKPDLVMECRLSPNGSISWRMPPSIPLACHMLKLLDVALTNMITVNMMENKVEEQKSKPKIWNPFGRKK